MSDPHQLIIGRHRAFTFRHHLLPGRGEDWLSLFDDPTLGNSALDRLTIEGTSYRGRLSHRALLDKVAKILGKAQGG